MADFDSSDYLASSSNTGYDASTDTMRDYGSTGTDLSGLTSILGQFKGVFDRLKTGSTTTADVNAALGVLGLIMPSLTAPKTAGWKGSIDLSKQFTRTPMVNPAATYTPYSGKPVMGQQYFTSTYGAAGAPPAAAPATPPATAPGLDAAPQTELPDISTTGGGMARGGIASLRRFAQGGATTAPINVQSLGFGGNKPVDMQQLNSLLSKSTGQSLYFPAGTYTFSSPLSIPSNITLMGDGAGKTVFLAGEDYDPKSPLARAEPQGSAININGITFDGGNNSRENRPLVELGFVSDVNFTNSAVQNTPYTGLDLNGARNATVQGSVFTNIGNPERTEMGGPAIYVGGDGENQAKNVNVVGNTFKDNNWSAAYFMPDGGQFSNNTCINNGESTLFMNNTGKNVTIANNTIDGSRRMDISASGLELGGQNLKVYGNTISNVGNDGITLTDVSNSQIENNNLFNNGQENTYDAFKHAAGIGVKSFAQNSNNVVQNNTIYDSQQNPTQQYGVFGWSQGRGAGWGNSQIANNTMYGNARDNLYDMTGGLQSSFGSNIFQPPASQQGFGEMAYDVGEGQIYTPSQPFGFGQQPAQQPAQQVQQPMQQQAAPTGLAAMLPSEWSKFGSQDKIDWFNQNQITPQQLLGAGVQQDEIDFMGKSGYLGGQPETGGFQPLAQPFAQTTAAPATGIASAMPAPQQNIAEIVRTLQEQQPQRQPFLPSPTPEPVPDMEGEQVLAAQGGLMGLARGGKLPPRYLRGQTDGMADKIPSNIDGVQPAKLSHGEFVIPADVVSHLGNGNSDAGAKVLYKMMDRVRQARTGTKKQGRQINPEKFTPGGIAGYAGGGAVAFQTGGAAPPPPTAPLGTSTETNISSWAGPYVGDMLSKTAALTNAPYQAYTGPLSAGYSPLQQKMFTGLESLSFPGQLGQTFTAAGAPMLPTAATTGPMQTVGATGIASQYMNPYLNAVLQPQLEEMRRQAQISQTGIGAKFAGPGGSSAYSAPGGARQTIAEAELQRNLLGEMNKAIGTGYASAYDKALQQFNVEQGQAKTLAEMMAGAGAQQRGIEQEGISEARKQFETEQLKPYTDLRFQREMISGLPVATTATTANTSTYGQLNAGMAELAKALEALGIR